MASPSRLVAVAVVLMGAVALFAVPCTADSPCPPMDCNDSAGVKSNGYSSYTPASNGFLIQRTNQPADCFKSCDKTPNCNYWHLVKSKGPDICFFYNTVSTTCTDSLSDTDPASAYSSANLIGCVPPTAAH